MNNNAHHFDIADFLVVEHEHDCFENFSQSSPMTPNYDEPGTANYVPFKINPTPVEE